MEHIKDLMTLLKMKLVIININCITIKKEINNLIKTNTWILEDKDLSKSVYNLFTMASTNNQDLVNLINEINELEETCEVFSLDDLADEIDYLEENSNLFISYLNNISLYIPCIDDVTLPSYIFEEKYNEYLDSDIACFNQFMINHENLKELIKERRD